MSQYTEDGTIRSIHCWHGRCHCAIRAHKTPHYWSSTYCWVTIEKALYGSISDWNRHYWSSPWPWVHRSHANRGRCREWYCPRLNDALSEKLLVGIHVYDSSAKACRTVFSSELPRLPLHLVVLSDHRVVITRYDVGLCNVSSDVERMLSTDSSTNSQWSIDVGCRFRA